MTKKIILLLTLVMMVLPLGACTKKEGGEKSNSNYEGSLYDLMDEIYKENPVDLALGDPFPIDLEDSDSLFYFLGLSDKTEIKEAICSEPMMGSQAYSLCLIRTSEDANTEEMMKTMLNDVDLRKWICVTADKLIVTSYGDVVALIMTDSNLSENLTDDLYGAFAKVVGGKSDKKLERLAE